MNPDFSQRTDYFPFKTLHILLSPRISDIYRDKKYNLEYETFKYEDPK